MNADLTVDQMFDWIEARRYGAMYQNGRLALVTDETYAEVFVHEGSLVDCFAAAVGFINANRRPACSPDCKECTAVGALSVAPEATGEHDDCQHNVDQDSDCADDRSFTRVRDLMSEDERKAMYDDLGKLARLRSRVPDCPHTPVTQQGSKQCVCGEPNDADVHRFDRSPGSPKATT